ncbi:MAG: hypothetical protein NTV80_07235, partial [Verrucomicrobia bacterium]|nr:hypothetical protein [Verrucomicrobiota bacterium]
MNQELPPPKNVRKMTPAEGRFACYWWSAQHSGVAWSEREVSTREACAKGEAEIKWARDKAKEIHQELIEDSNRRTAGQPCMSKAEHTAKEAEQERISEACSSWKIGEEIRQRRLWIEECEEWAEMKIQGRKTHMEKEGFSLAEFAVEGLESVQCDGPEARSRLQHTALWLPVYYEYARQSPHLLMWSRMLNTMGKGDIMRPGAASELTTALKHQLGGGWVSALSWLCGYLGEDRSFSCVPSEKRLSVACGAANATLSHIEVNPDTWAIEDGGRPACP